MTAKCTDLNNSLLKAFFLLLNVYPYLSHTKSLRLLFVRESEAALFSTSQGTFLIHSVYRSVGTMTRLLAASFLLLLTNTNIAIFSGSREGSYLTE